MCQLILTKSKGAEIEVPVGEDVQPLAAIRLRARLRGRIELLVTVALEKHLDLHLPYSPFLGP